MSSEHEFGNVGSEDVLNTGAAHFGPTKFHNPGNRKCPVNVQSFEVSPRRAVKVASEYLLKLSRLIIHSRLIAEAVIK